MTEVLILSSDKPEKGRLHDAAENLIIAIGMGWDVDGIVAEVRSALSEQDAKDEAVQAMDRVIAYLCGDGQMPADMDAIVDASLDRSGAKLAMVRDAS